MKSSRSLYIDVKNVFFFIFPKHHILCGSDTVTDKILKLNFTLGCSPRTVGKDASSPTTGRKVFLEGRNETNKKQNKKQANKNRI